MRVECSDYMHHLHITLRLHLASTGFASATFAFVKTADSSVGSDVLSEEHLRIVGEFTEQFVLLSADTTPLALSSLLSLLRCAQHAVVLRDFVQVFAIQLKVCVCVRARVRGYTMSVQPPANARCRVSMCTLQPLNVTNEASVPSTLPVPQQAIRYLHPPSPATTPKLHFWVRVCI
jgi:hypothetical protein